MANVGFESYLRWPTAKKSLVWIGVGLLIGAVAFFVFLQPQIDALSSLERQSAQLADEVVQKKAIAANITAVEQAVNEMNKLLKEALTRLPSDAEIPSLMKQISNLARDADLTSMLFRPQPHKPVGFYAEIPLLMKEQGGFRELAMFFDKVGRLPRIVTIESINVNTMDYDNEDQPRLQAEFTATTFKYLPPEARVAEDGKNKGKNK